MNNSAWWSEERRQRAERILVELEKGRLQGYITDEMRAALSAMDDGYQLSRDQRELLGALHGLVEDSPFGRPRNRVTHEHKGERGSYFIASPEGDDDMRNHAPSIHPPLTTGPEGHEHDHAAGDDPGAHDGMHRHPHVHEMDADHDTDVHRRGGGERPGRVPETGQHVRPGQAGSYGAEMSGRLGPAQRAASRRARITDLDRRRGGSA